MRRRKKGNVIIAVLCVVFAIALTATVSTLIVARYSASIRSRYERLQEDVLDEGSIAAQETFGGGEA